MDDREVYADLVIKAVLAKIKAMETLDRGILSDTSVTTFDRLIVIVGSLNPRYRDRLLSTKPTSEDVDSVVRASDVSLYDEEVILMAKLRRFVIEIGKRGVERVCDALAYDGFADAKEDRIKVS